MRGSARVFFFSLALGSLQLAFSIASDLPDHIAVVRSLISRRELGKAESLAVRQLASRAHDPAWILLLAEIRLDQQRFAESLQLVKDAQDLAGRSAQGELLAGLDYVAMRRNDLAEPELRAAVELDSSDPAPNYYLGRLLYNRNSFDEAIQFTLRALALNPNLVRAYDNLGLCYEAESLYEQAKEQYLKGVQLQRASGEAVEWPALDLGTMLLAHGNQTEAISYLREAVTIAPKSADTHFRLGTALQASEAISGATAEYQKAIELNPCLAAAHYRLAALYRRSGQFTLAEKELLAFQQSK